MDAREPAQTGEFAGGYTRTQRIVETGALLIFFSLEAFLLVRLASAVPDGALLSAPFAVLLGFLCADFISGFVHWFCDTWGSVDWPLVGQTVLRTFREHHFDPKAITHHDFVETNGSNAFIGVVPMLCGMLAPRETWWGWALWLSGGTMSFFVLMTSQIHKWAHSGERPALVRLLQRSRLLLSPEHHEKHHLAPFTSNYAITAGWLNPVFGALDFFPRLERLITWATGVQPRVDPLSDKLRDEVLARVHARSAPPLSFPEQAGHAEAR